MIHKPRAPQGLNAFAKKTKAIVEPIYERKNMSKDRQDFLNDVDNFLLSRIQIHSPEPIETPNFGEVVTKSSLFLKIKNHVLKK